MADFDDYFGDDDFILDEAAEAALAETERQYATQAQQSVERPVPKRQRTATGWTAGLGSRSDSYGDFDSYPEIIVNGDGYQASARSRPRPLPAPPRAPACLAPAPARPKPLQRQPQQNTALPQGSGQAATPNHLTQAVDRPLSAVSHGPARNPAPAQGTHPLEGQLQELRQQLEELRQSNSHLQSALQDAVDTKTRKEGEVTILRKTIEKHTQDHTAEVLRLRAARQESEAKQIQVQKTLKEDMERLKTQLLFKQQELEASLRKPPGSARAKKGPREPPATPLAGASNRGWHAMSQRPKFNLDVQQTPSRMTFKPPPKMTSPRKNNAHKSPSKPQMLPGFQNSFTASTPLKSRSKGKEKECAVDDGNVFDLPLLSQPLPPLFSTLPKPTQNKGPPPEPSFPPSSPQQALPVFESQPQTFESDCDVAMSTETQQIEELEEEYDVIEAPNWKAELCRIILTHVRPGCAQLSFHQLLSVTFNGAGEVEDSRQYMTAYTGIMNAISHPTSTEGYVHCLADVAHCFIAMAQILARYELKSQMASLFDLLSTLVFFLPNFRSSILGHGDATHSPLISLLCAVITSSLSPTQEDKCNLGKSILGLLETIAFELSDEDALSFSEFARSRQVIDTLFHSDHLHALFEQVVRILVFLATRKPLCWALLSLPDPGQADIAGPTQKNGLTERLCTFLVDPTCEAPDFYSIKDNILTYFAQLSLACPEAFAHLAGHSLLLASTLWHTSHLTTPLYEDDERLMQSTLDSARLVQYISQAVYFIYHLMVGDMSSGGLRHKLQQAPPRPFNNLQHVFIVAFGRLVYSLGPDWLEDKIRNQLLQLKDISLWIFNEVVGDGPELDVIASAYNDDPTRSQSMLDEGEMEAEMVEAEY